LINPGSDLIKGDIEIEKEEDKDETGTV